MSGPTLRAMDQWDLAAVAAIEQAAYPFPWSVGNFSDSLKAQYGCAVLEDNGTIIGYTVVMNAVDDLHLLNITVAPPRQGQGLSHRLLDWIEQIARRDGCSGVLLEVRPSNARAVAIYERLGFVRIGMRSGYYPAAQGREDAMVMRKLLFTPQTANKRTHYAAS